MDTSLRQGIGNANFEKNGHYENIIQLYLLPVNLLLSCLSDLAYDRWANMTDHIVDATLNSDYFGREML